VEIFFSFFRVVAVVVVVVVIVVVRLRKIKGYVDCPGFFPQK